MANKKTEVISFRVPVETAQLIDLQAKRIKKRRAEFVKSLFLPTFENLAAISKSPKTTT